MDSFKMKGSVVLGVFQMCFGLSLAFLNHRYFNDNISLFYEWIPQVLFMACIFVYLCITIFVKWITWDSKTAQYAPSLLINLIGMFMLKVPGTEDRTWVYGGTNCTDPFADDQQPCLATSQNVIQKFLLFVAVICIPVMLFAKPYMKYKAWQEKRNRGTTSFGGVRVQVDGNDDTANILEEDELANEHAVTSPTASGDAQEEEAFDLGGTMIIQVIHTIEYALGCISHTASYLRLWALSLAHAELSEVLWNMVLHIGLSAGSSKSATGAVMMFLVFWAFSTLSVGILIGMEGLSAFLHALRLHWVEFNSKFYDGEGIQFVPFHFATILSGEEV